MNENNLLTESSKHGLQDDDVTRQYKIMGRIVVNEEGESEACQNCGVCFFPCDDYVTLCKKCRYELLGI